MTCYCCFLHVQSYFTTEALVNLTPCSTCNVKYTWCYFLMTWLRRSQRLQTQETWWLSFPFKTTLLQPQTAPSARQQHSDNVPVSPDSVHMSKCPWTKHQTLQLLKVPKGISDKWWRINHLKAKWFVRLYVTVPIRLNVKAPPVFSITYC